MHEGSCDCGRIAFEVEGDFSTAVECNCSHCQRKGYLLVMVARDRLVLKTPEEAMSTYRFNKHVIEHRFCPDCGCAPFGLGVDEDGTRTAAINIRCLEEIDLTKVERIAFDGRSW